MFRIVRRFRRFWIVRMFWMALIVRRFRVLRSLRMTRRTPPYGL